MRSGSISWNTLDTCESEKWSSGDALTRMVRSSSTRKARRDRTCKGFPLRRVSVCSLASLLASSKTTDLLKALFDAHWVLERGGRLHISIILDHNSLGSKPRWRLVCVSLAGHGFSTFCTFSAHCHANRFGRTSWTTKVITFTR